MFKNEDEEGTRMREILDKYNLKAEECGLTNYSFGSLEEQLAAVKQNGYCITYIQNPSERVQLAAVKQDGYCIQYIQNPFEEVQLAAIKQDGNCIRFVQNPSEEAQLAAVKQNGFCITYIQNPSEKVQLAAVQSADKLFANITSEKVIEYFCKNMVMRKALE